MEDKLGGRSRKTREDVTAMVQVREDGGFDQGGKLWIHCEGRIGRIC